MVGTVRPGPTSARATYLGGVRLVPIDHTVNDGLADLVTEITPDEIYNLAAQSSVGRSWDLPDVTRAVNTGTVEQLILGALRARDRTGARVRLLQASSAEVRGAAAHSPYGQSKAAADELVRRAREERGLFAASVFLHNHDSPLRGEAFVTRKISRSVAEIGLGRRERLVLGNLAVRRDWGFAGEYVDAMRGLLDLDEPVDLEIGTGRVHSLEQLVQAAFTAAGLGRAADFIDHDPALMRPADAEELVADPGPASRILGWQARYTLEDLIARMVAVDLQRLRTGVEESLDYLAPPTRVTAS